MGCSKLQLKKFIILQKEDIFFYQASHLQLSKVGDTVVGVDTSRSLMDMLQSTEPQGDVEIWNHKPFA